SSDKTIASGSGQDFRILGINSSIIVTLALISPIVFTLIVYPDSFSLSWNQGRGGFLFAMAFIAAELIGVQYRVSTRRLLVVCVLAAVTIAYFASLPFGVVAWIKSSAPSPSVQMDSWQWMWDFV